MAAIDDHCPFFPFLITCVGSGRSCSTQWRPLGCPNDVNVSSRRGRRLARAATKRCTLSGLVAAQLTRRVVFFQLDGLFALDGSLRGWAVS
jgi:hypothetical protein